MIDLTTNIGNLNLDNPILLASGILDQTADSMEIILEGGMGGVITKSIGFEPREGHPNPTMVELEHGLLNAMGLPNPGIDIFKREIRELLEKTDKIVVGSIFAGESQGFVKLAEDMENSGVHAIELNLSCPHAEGYGSMIGKDPDLVENIVKNVKENVSIPVFAKLPPFSDIVNVSRFAEKGGADAIVLINTIKAMSINFETRKPVLGNKVGGYSGPAIKPVGLRCVYEVYKEVDVPIIGCGGINNGRDALEYILAGASALQVGSAIYYRGKETGKLINDEIKGLMGEEEISTLKELIGSAHR